MTPALSSAAALAWLESLSAEARPAAVLDATGTCRAGDPALGARATALLAAVPGPAELRAGPLVVARSARHAIAVETGPQVLVSLLVGDLRAALTALAGTG